MEWSSGVLGMERCRANSVGSIDLVAPTDQTWTPIVFPDAGKNHSGVLFLLVFGVCFLMKRNETRRTIICLPE